MDVEYLTIAQFNIVKYFKQTDTHTVVINAHYLYYLYIYTGNHF